MVQAGLERERRAVLSPVRLADRDSPSCLLFPRRANQGLGAKPCLASHEPSVPCSMYFWTPDTYAVQPRPPGFVRTYSTLLLHHDDNGSSTEEGMYRILVIGRGGGWMRSTSSDLLPWQQPWVLFATLSAVTDWGVDHHSTDSQTPGHVLHLSVPPCLARCNRYPCQHCHPSISGTVQLCCASHPAGPVLFSWLASFAATRGGPFQAMQHALPSSTGLLTDQGLLLTHFISFPKAPPPKCACLCAASTRAAGLPTRPPWSCFLFHWPNSRPVMLSSAKSTQVHGGWPMRLPKRCSRNGSTANGCMYSAPLCMAILFALLTTASVSWYTFL